MKKIAKCSVCYEDHEMDQKDLILYHKDDRSSVRCNGVGYPPAFVASKVDAGEDIICPGCNNPTWLAPKDDIGIRKGQIVSHCTDPVLGEDAPCGMSYRTYQAALNIVKNETKTMPGPNDFGYKYHNTGQRDPHNPSKPIAR